MRQLWVVGALVLAGCHFTANYAPANYTATVSSVQAQALGECRLKEIETGTKPKTLGASLFSGNSYVDACMAAKGYARQ